MKSTVHFPPTHYDVILRNQPFIKDYIEREIAVILEKGLEGPFGSVDEFSDFFEDYMYEYNAKFREHCRSIYPNINADEDFEAMLKSSASYPTIMYNAHMDYVNAVNFNLFGKKTFYLSESIVDRLSVTELNAPAEYLRLPFKTCMFVLTGKTAIDALLAITDINEKTYSDAITVFLHEKSYKEYSKIIITAAQVGYERNRCLVKREILIHPDWDIDRAIRTDWNKLYNEHPNWLDLGAKSVGKFLEVEDEDESHFYHAGRAFFRIILNAVLYLASNDPDIIEATSPVKQLEQDLKGLKSESKRAKRRRLIDKKSNLDGHIVGANLPPIKVVKGAGEGNCIKSDTTTTTTLRFMVRGHWKSQSYGQGRKLRKLIHIEPYLKGPDAGDVINKPYLVE